MAAGWDGRKGGFGARRPPSPPIQPPLVSIPRGQRRPVMDHPDRRCAFCRPESCPINPLAGIINPSARGAPTVRQAANRLVPRSVPTSSISAHPNVFTGRYRTQPQGPKDGGRTASAAPPHRGKGHKVSENLGKLFHSGQVVPESGVYQVTNGPRPGQPPQNVTFLRTRRFPSYPDCHDVTFELIYSDEAPPRLRR